MKKIIVANWKMNPASPKEAKKLFGAIKKKAAFTKGSVETVVAPPFVYLPLLSPTAKVKLGAQDVFFEDEGAFTGEISPAMLRHLGVSYVIVGHSERREHVGESDEVIHKKILAAALRHLRAIVCVGEKERHREGFPPRVKEEILGALKGVPRALASRILIAYEPLWAISANKGAHEDSPENVFEISIFIRRTVMDIWGKKAALSIPILYGGSVNAKNARGFLEVKGISGLLVGGASLKAEEFGAILRAASL
mgnify:CR=1 FL=1